LFNDAVSSSGYGTSNAVCVIMVSIEIFALKDMKYRPIFYEVRLVLDVGTALIYIPGF
jgi:hypothetical protein